MLVFPDGEILGTVGGGELENRVRKEALASLQDGQPRLLSYKMTDPPGEIPGFVEVRWRCSWNPFCHPLLLS